jgi:hypothetical protein
VQYLPLYARATKEKLYASQHQWTATEVTQPLRDYVLEKLARLEGHFDKITNVQVIMKVEKLQQKIEATLQTRRRSGRQCRTRRHVCAIDALPTSWTAN